MRAIYRIAGYEGKRMLIEQEAIQYCGMGRTRFREWAKEHGCVTHIGKSVRYDKQAIDRALDALMAAENQRMKKQIDE